MPLDPTSFNAQFDSAQCAVATLDTSCQAVVEAEIQQIESSWYAEIDKELGAAEELVLAWRRSGTLYFNTDMREAVRGCAVAFAGAQAEISGLFNSLEQSFSTTVRDAIVEKLRDLSLPVNNISDSASTYSGQLQVFEQQMSTVDQQIQSTVAAAQAEEADIQAEIAVINASIADLAQQIQTDRKAIASARSDRTQGIVETIFGVVLVPFTGGASLALAAIGVASIADAEEQISHLDSQISSFQGQISSDQTTLSNDQKIVASLKGLLLSTGFVLNDIQSINSSLDSLRTAWEVFNGELIAVTTRLAAAADTSEVVLSSAWFDSACAAWTQISAHLATIDTWATSTSRRGSFSTGKFQPALP